MALVDDLKQIVSGDVSNDTEVINKHSRDTSLFKVVPEVVVFPKDVSDIKKVVSFVSQNKKDRPTLSITGRSAGTDMTGGPLNESVILSFTKYLNKFSVDVENKVAVVEPGVFYRDFEKETAPANLTMPSYPASKSIAALGGMIMNNSGGEKTLRYGQTRNFVESLKMVLSDGNEYEFKSLNKEELDSKIKQNDFEGEIYKKTFNLLESNFDLIQKAKPKVTKNSAGFALWDVWDRNKFDLTQLFTGSQGTLGVLTSGKLRLVKEKPHRKMIAIFFKSWDALPAVVRALLPYDPESLETFDDATLKLGLRFMPEVAKKAHMSFLKFAFQFLPEALMGLKMLGIPKLIVLAEFSEDNADTLREKIFSAQSVLQKFKVETRVLHNEQEEEKYWVMRRESFNLLREHVRGKKTAPFVEDFCVSPDNIPKFLPEVLKILKKNGIVANIAGHAGNGNFHIIPLMDMTKRSERDKVLVVADLIYALIVKFGGTITAEHNDGIMRTPYLELMYGKEMYSLFKEIKQIFDPQNIFNPGKKIGGSKDYLNSHIASK